MSPIRSIDDTMAEIFQQDPGYAVELLNDILDDGDLGELGGMLRQMRAAFGTEATAVPAMDEVAVAARDLPALLKSVGLRLTIVPITGDQSKAA